MVTLNGDEVAIKVCYMFINIAYGDVNNIVYAGDMFIFFVLFYRCPEVPRCYMQDAAREGGVSI